MTKVIVEVTRESGNNVTVNVVMQKRKYVRQELKILTTEGLIDILNNEHNIKVSKTISKPKTKIGNSDRNGVSLSGTWIFEELKNTSKEEKDDQKPTQQKKRQSRPKKTNTSSIRSRMSKLAAKED